MKNNTIQNKDLQHFESLGFDLSLFDKFQRAKDTSKNKANKNLALYLGKDNFKSTEYIYYWFKNYATGEVIKGNTFKESNSLTDQEKQAFKANLKRLNKERERKQEELEKEKKECIKNAWQKIKSLDNKKDLIANHKYLKSKGFNPDFIKKTNLINQCKINNSNNLCVPFLSLENKITGWQKIAENGGKYIEKDSVTSFFRLSHSQEIESEYIYIVEGLATGLSILQATLSPVFVAFNVHNIEKTLNALKGHASYKDKKIILCGDNDYKQGKRENIGIDKVKELEGKYFNVSAIYPDRGIKEDFNDVHKEKGLKAVESYFVDLESAFNIFKQAKKLDKKELEKLAKEKEKEVVEILEAVEYRLNKEDIETYNKLINLTKEINILITESFNKEYCIASLGSKSAYVDLEALHSKEISVFEKFKLKDKAFLIDYFANTSILQSIRKTKNGDIKTIFKSYFDIFLSSKNRLSYKNIYFSPDPKDNRKNELNLFTGFNISKKEALELSEKEAIEKSKFYFNHAFKALCNEDKESYEYLLNYLSHMFQRPEELPKKALVWSNTKEGIGKNVFFNAIRFIVGSYSKDFKDINDLTGRFSSERAFKIMLVADEATWGGDKQREGLLKALITDINIKLEKKFYDPETIQNYTRLFVTSNENYPVPVGANDRRFVFFETSDRLKGDTRYFNNFIEKLRDRNILKAIARVLYTRDIKDFNLDNRPSITEKLALDSKIKGLSSAKSFWLNCLDEKYNFESQDINEPNKYHQGWTDEIFRKDFLESYYRYCEKQNIKYIEKPESFWNEFKELVPQNTIFRKAPTGVSGRQDRKIIFNSDHETCKKYFYKEILNIKKLELIENIEKSSIDSFEVPFEIKSMRLKSWREI